MAAKVGLRILFAQEHDADGERDFRINDMLLEELLGQIGGKEGEIARLAQERGHPLEGFDELGKVAVIVAAAHLVFSQRDHVPRGEAQATAGRIEPSRWRCSSALGREAMRGGNEECSTLNFSRVLAICEAREER